MKYFDPDNQKLIFIEQAATSAYWDSLWDQEGIDQSLFRKNSLISAQTARFLKPADGLILEGGCGRAQHVFALQSNGFSAVGLDYAPQALATAKQVVASLKLTVGSVFEIPLPSESCAGYWSLGLIEHFWEGYDPLIIEAARVLKPNGYLFLTFPNFSPLRKLKARWGYYPNMSNAAPEPENFYQFALEHSKVVEVAQKYGFQLEDTVPMNGLKGLKDEIDFLNRPLQSLYDYSGRSYLLRGLRYTLTKWSAPWAGHSILLVLKKGLSHAF